MPIKAVCGCGASLKAPEGAAGKNLPCPVCRQLVAIPPMVELVPERRVWPWLAAGMLALVGGCIALVYAFGPTNTAVVHDPPQEGKRLPRGIEARKFESALLHKSGTAAIAFSKAEVGQILVTGLVEPEWSADSVLAIHVNVGNLHDAKILRYHGWGKERLFRSPTLEDEHGNRYKMISFGFRRPYLQVDEEAIPPGKAKPDYLVFEPPIEQAKWLVLKLPLDNIGRPGEVAELVIPADKIQKKPSPFGNPGPPNIPVPRMPN